jgi:2-haloacid dehalogenase
VAISGAVQRVEALTFDVFGTVVDWRSSIIRELEAFGRAKGVSADWAGLTDGWRALYQPQLSRVRDGKLPWTKLDDLHRESLEQLLVRFGIQDLAEGEKDHLNRVWHRLDPWPDSVPGLRRLHAKYPLATLSNGNVALLVHMARRAGLPWDAVLGAEVARQYKPRPEPYLVTAELLGLRPDRCMLVAAHNGDLVAAGALGYRTAFIPRPTEDGPGQSRDLAPEHPFDLVARDMVDLAVQLGC